MSAGDYRAEVAEVGAGLAGLWHGEQSITVPYADQVLPPMSSGAVLLPWPNRIRDGRYSLSGKPYQLPLTEPDRLNAIHGLVRWVRWSVIEQNDSSITLEHWLVPQTGYPFALRLALRYALDPDDGLSVRTWAANVGDDAAPFGAGFHPYLDLSGQDFDEVAVEIPAESVLIVDERMIPAGRSPVSETAYDFRETRPIGSLRLDHGFTDLTNGRARVEASGMTRELWWEPAFGYLQVFTPEESRFGTTALAVEPMTCPANAFASAESLIVLAPAEEFSASWGIRDAT
jgi:aldose 1-epimerase